MEAARTAKLCGHNVELYESADSLGGHLKEAGSHPFKDGIARLNRWYQQELNSLSVPVFLNHTVTAQEIREGGFDAVILATGSEYFVPSFVEGLDHEKAMVCRDVLLGTKKTDRNVVVVGGGLTGSELAYDLASYEGKHVVLVEAQNDILSSGPAIPQPVSLMLRDLLEYSQVEICTGTKIKAVIDEGAVVEDAQGMKKVIPADAVVFCIGLKKTISLRNELLYSGIEIYETGDGAGIGNIRTAIASAYEIARNL